MVNKKNTQITSQKHLRKDVGFDVDTAGPFGDNYACAHAYKKLEKVLIALYLVTNFVPEGEPARTILRDKSTRVLSDILELRFGFHSTDSKELDRVIASLYETISLLNILHVAGFISSMNLDILKRELGGLIVFLREVENSEVSEKVRFNDDTFKVEEGDKGLYGRHGIKDKDMSLNKRHTNTALSHGTGRVRKVSASGSLKERKDIIINLVRDKNSVNIKDISAVITNCSEKTIQRALIALVHEGILKKEGERRWSTYSLN